MSAARNMKGESIAILLRHEEMPIIVALICEMFNKRKEVYVKKGFVFNSNQRLKPSRITREALKLVFEPPGDGRNKFLQDVAAHPKVRRGDYPIADLNLDTSRKYCEMELSEMNALLGTSAPLPLTVGGSKVIGPEAAANGTASSSRKRSYSRVAYDDTANKSLEGPKGAKVATDRSLRAYPASVDGGRSSDRKASVASGGNKGPLKCQTDKLMDWMKKNNYNPSPDVYAIDELVDSTKMKPSQIVTWIKEMGNNAAKLHKHPEIIVIDDDDDEDSVPELDEEEDVYNGLVTRVEVKSKAVEEVAFDLLCVETPESSLDSLLLGPALDYGDTASLGSIRTGHSCGQQQKSSAPCVSLTDCEESELFEYLWSHLENEHECKDKGKLERPSKRDRSDSLDSLFALLD